MNITQSQMLPAPHAQRLFPAVRSLFACPVARVGEGSGDHGDPPPPLQAYDDACPNAHDLAAVQGPRPPDQRQVLLAYWIQTQYAGEEEGSEAAAAAAGEEAGVEDEEGGSEEGGGEEGGSEEGAGDEAAAAEAAAAEAAAAAGSETDEEGEGQAEEDSGRPVSLGSAHTPILPCHPPPP